MHNDLEYSSVSVSIRGWMKETGKYLNDTRKIPIHPEYDGNITITCIIDGKELEFKISKLEWMGY
jgi:hypothetical protein